MRTIVAGMVLAGLVACSAPTERTDDPGTTRSPADETPVAAGRSSPGWRGALRVDQGFLPLLSEADGWMDDADAAPGWIDITHVSATARPGWTLGLRAAPPLASALDPARRVMEHGVVVDADGDRVADCRIGISTDAPKPGDLRVWVTNLDTGETVEEVGPPYGVPIDFFHPAEGEEPATRSTENRRISLFSLRGPAPCELEAPAGYYAYAVLLRPGEDPVWDFAPDHAWTSMR